MNSLALTIRCPHQPNDDLKIEAKSDWTVRQLKVYLSDVHESKPAPERQRIVFAGQLLRDETRLGECFQRYSSNFDGQDSQESQESYVLHMVYTSSVESSVAAAEKRAKEETELRRRGQPASPNLSTQSARVNSSPSPSPSPSPLTSANGGPYQMPQWGWNGWPQMQMGGGLDGANDWAQQQQQMYMAMNVMMSQWYSQYMQAMYGGTAGFFPMAQIQPSANVSDGGQQEQQQVEPVAQQGAPRPEPPRQPAMNAQGGIAAEDDEEDPRNRDWLDYIYMTCRASLLLMILYFYSSIERFIFVVLCCAVMYGLQAGWFGRRGQQQNQPQPQARARPAQGPIPNNPVVDAADGGGERNGTEETDQSRVTPAQDTPMTAWNVFWSTCWTFISSFFASLVPERPPPLNM